MGAYYQNHVVTKNKETGEEFTLVIDGGSLKFMETQYALNNTMKNVVRELSSKTSEDNPALVFCVCDYDKQEENRYTQEWLDMSTFGLDRYKETRQAVRVLDTQDEYGDPELEIVDNSRYIQGSKNEMVDGLFSGFVICKNTKEYLDIEKIKAISTKVYDEHQELVVSPIALLTRKNKQSMGGGDITLIKLAEQLEKYLTKWYENNIYWSSEQPSDEFSDITTDTLVIEKLIKESEVESKNNESNNAYYYLVPVYGTKHSPYPNL